MHSTHEGVNTALWGLELDAGDNLVTTDEEHPGVLVPLRHLRDRRAIDVRVAPWGADDEAFVDAIGHVVDARTRAVVISHVSWVSGRIAPLRALRDALPAHCRIIVDGAQSAGVLATDPVTDGWDAYTVSGQKWPCGPNGSGGLALVDPTAWAPTFGGYMQVTDPTHCLTAPLVRDGRRFETSQEAMAPLVGFAASVEWLVTHVGIDRALAHARQLNARARTRLAPVLATVGIDPERGMLGDAHLLCIDVPEGRAVELVAALCERGIVIRSLSPSRIRISLGCWNRADEVDACVAALGELLSPTPQSA
jgi:L-cysteine/cystine lyase